MYLEDLFMNKQTADILKLLKNSSERNQRKLADASGYSLGAVNKAVKDLMEAGYIDSKFRLSSKAEELFEKNSPRNAIILAAGFGMRMVPINQSTPKPFLEVRGERLIERLIRQLHEAGIEKITVVAGFMKEDFEYLIDDFNVDLIINEEYASRNNLHSLCLVKKAIHNTYIIPSDLWCAENPFCKDELYSWYLVSDEDYPKSAVRISRKFELVPSDASHIGKKMIGISYICEDQAERLVKRLAEMDRKKEFEQAFWEEALFDEEQSGIYANIAPGDQVIEINTYEQLREVDSNSNQLKSDAIGTIASVFNVKPADVRNISVLKKGMTNRSFLFTVNDKKYIMRIPGEGTDQLISRRNEAAVYQAIRNLGLCDDPVYINPDNGYKITSYLENVRVCDAENIDDLSKCMKKLKSFHQMKLQVPHVFDIFRQIDFYESLWNGNPSVYRDYEKTKANVFRLKDYVDSVEKEWCLTHIDSVPDNFLFYQDENGNEALQLTDWEYASMQDPHVDLAMFIIYSLYNKEEADRLIDIYFENQCDRETRIKIYCYIAMCGLLWSNWCEFKRQLGVEFGEYSLRQYRYAKDYYKYAQQMLDGEQK